MLMLIWLVLWLVMLLMLLMLLVIWICAFGESAFEWG